MQKYIAIQYFTLLIPIGSRNEYGIFRKKKFLKKLDPRAIAGPLSKYNLNSNRNWRVEKNEGFSAPISHELF